jgi:hypothetical protein
MAQYEDAAGSLRTDRAFNHLAGIRRLKLETSVATFVAIRMNLIVDRNFGNLWLRSGHFRRRAEGADSSYGAAEQ